MDIFDGFNDEAPSIDGLKGDKNHLSPFLISSFGNSLFLKFEVEASLYAVANPSGFFATIHYGKKSEMVLTKSIIISNFPSS